MRAKFDMLKQKTRAELSDGDRKALGKAIEVLTNLQVCDQVNDTAKLRAAATVTAIRLTLDDYPGPKGCDESKARTPPADTKPAQGNP